MKTSLSDPFTREIGARLEAANLAFAERYPGEAYVRRPVHTVYGGAHLVAADTAAKLGATALRALDEHAAGLGSMVGATVLERVRAKLMREPIEDYRIDFEDGYGNRPASEEDGHAARAAVEVAKGMAEGTLSPFIGIRIKPLNEEMRDRSIRTLDIFLSTLCDATSGELPPGFAVTLPKVTIGEQVAALVDLFQELEAGLGLARGALKLEIMVESPQVILDAGGRSALRGLVDTAAGRCVAAHFGAYDYTASCDITAASQALSHPACDFARHMMQVALAGTGVRLSDGATNVLPVPVHRARRGGPALGETEIADNQAAILRAFKLHYENIQSALRQGYYQGWDLHPAQLPIRYAAVYSFFLEGLSAAAARLRTFVERAARASLVGDVFDDAATGQGLLNYFLRAIGCGAITEAEAQAATGLDAADLRSRSFLTIAERRRE